MSEQPTTNSPAAPCGEQPLAATVYYDGACPLCRMEISHYRRQRGAESIVFVDASKTDAELGADLDRATALARFHVRDRNGILLSGAAAFVAAWTALPRWRWAAGLARLPGMAAAMECGYRAFLRVRPALARIAGRYARRGAR